MLTPEQIVERKKGIGSSDAYKIATGDWYDLWREKTGRYEPGAILSPWDALLRHYIEPAMMDFYQVEYGCDVTRRGEAVICSEHPILRATLDGADMGGARVVDAKLLNLFTPDPRAWLIEKYSWQMVHAMIVCQLPHASLYASVGMAKPKRIDFEYNEFEAVTYIDQCRAFWEYVERDIEPPGGPALETPVPIEQMREVSMVGNNAWAASAADWIEHGVAAKKFTAAEKSLKGMVEADVRLAFGHGIQVSRDGRGLRIGASK